MDGSETSRLVARSSGGVLAYIDDMRWATDPPLGMSVTEVRSADVSDGYALLHLASRLNDTSGLQLQVGGRVLTEEEAGFTRYDETSRTIIARPGDEVLSEIADGRRISVLVDMAFLVRAVGEFFQRYGGSLRPPDREPSGPGPVFPDGGVPTGRQREAAEGVMRDRMSYVWGAPGTGKTQFVLASCIRGCLEAGERVAVFAPTNNSVEQVLRGVIAAIPEGMRDGILRLGVPTKQFLADFPEMCEDRQAQRRLDACARAVGNLREVLVERRCDSVRGCVLALRRDALGLEDAGEMVGRAPSSSAALEEVRAVYGLLGLGEPFPEGRAVSECIREVESRLYLRERPAASIHEYAEWTDGDITAEIGRLEGEAERLRCRSTGDRLSRARVVAATPQQLISRFRPRGSREDARMELDVDRIFLDEAGYCGLVQALALFTCGVPVSMLGDHMQLPPVDQVDDAVARERAESIGPLSEAFLWNMPALYCSDLLSEGVQVLRGMYLCGDPPSFRGVGRYDLNETRRFGSRLAAVLDRHVYRNGLTGEDGSDISIEVIDATCAVRDGRENPAEATAVRDLLRAESPDPASVCILSPYSAQCRLLRSKVPRRYQDCVMTVHGSQGREWDTVVLSVSDNSVPSREVPYRFTSSMSGIGLRVMNTAVSRARRRLVIVCDRSFWASREGELLAGLIEASEERGTQRSRWPNAAVSLRTASFRSWTSHLRSETCARRARLSASSASRRDATSSSSPFLSASGAARLSRALAASSSRLLLSSAALSESLLTADSSPDICASTILASSIVSSAVILMTSDSGPLESLPWDPVRPLNSILTMSSRGSSGSGPAASALSFPADADAPAWDDDSARDAVDAP